MEGIFEDEIVTIANESGKPFKFMSFDTKEVVQEAETITGVVMYNRPIFVNHVYVDRKIGIKQFGHDHISWVRLSEIKLVKLHQDNQF